MSRIRIDKKGCDACGVCVEVCPEGVLTLRNGVAQVRDEDSCLGVKASQSCSNCFGTTCTGCVACVRNCPNGAILIQ
ncbi:4Fe-4S binding protein [Candidatus Bathyarchaeota archaeon]|nr:4Fe-4S binding protein [Candidatus Bathyarchaeota archaeon]